MYIVQQYELTRTRSTAARRTSIFPKPVFVSARHWKADNSKWSNSKQLVQTRNKVHGPYIYKVLRAAQIIEKTDLESAQNCRENVDLDSLLSRRFRLFDAFSEMLQHLQTMFVSDPWKHEAEQPNWAVDDGDTERQRTRHRLALEPTIVSSLGKESKKNRDRNTGIILENIWWASYLLRWITVLLELSWRVQVC